MFSGAFLNSFDRPIPLSAISTVKRFVESIPNEILISEAFAFLELEIKLLNIIEISSMLTCDLKLTELVSHKIWNFE
jgi:hypothetical protein